MGPPRRSLGGPSVPPLKWTANFYVRVLDAARRPGLFVVALVR